MWATKGRYVEVVKVLLQAGVSVTSQGNWHALHEACKVGYTELVQVLIDAAAPVNNPAQCKFSYLFSHVVLLGGIIYLLIYCLKADFHY